MLRMAIQANTLYAIQEVPDVLPPRGDGRKTHPGTVRRWIDRGIGGKKLRTQTIGGRRFVPGDALLEFLGSDQNNPGCERAVKVQMARKYLKDHHGYDLR